MKVIFHECCRRVIIGHIKLKENIIYMAMLGHEYASNDCEQLYIKEIFHVSKTCHFRLVFQLDLQPTHLYFIVTHE